jgi:hypothetical protein
MMIDRVFGKNKVGINCVDFCHSAITKQALMAFAAPKVEKSWEFWSNCVNNWIKFAVC